MPQTVLVEDERKTKDFNVLEPENSAFACTEVHLARPAAYRLLRDVELANHRFEKS